MNEYQEYTLNELIGGIASKITIINDIYGCKIEKSFEFYLRPFDQTKILSQFKSAVEKMLEKTLNEIEGGDRYFITVKSDSFNLVRKSQLLVKSPHDPELYCEAIQHITDIPMVDELSQDKLSVFITIFKEINKLKT